MHLSIDVFLQLKFVFFLSLLVVGETIVYFHNWKHFRLNKMWTVFFTKLIKLMDIPEI